MEPFSFGLSFSVILNALALKYLSKIKIHYLSCIPVPIHFMINWTIEQILLC